MERHVVAGRADGARDFSRMATLWISLMATCVVILLPTAVVSMTVRMTAWTPHPVAIWVSTGSLSLGILMIGTRWWMRQPGSTTMSFGELMLWRWVRRRRADGVVQDGSLLLDPAEVRTRAGQIEMLRALNSALEVRDPFTRGHSQRVERHAYRTALSMHSSVEDIFNLRVAASLHDIGKIEVPIEVIRKQGPLDATEWDAMKGHPAAGAQMIANIGHEALVLAVRHHHERWDGKGYPDGLAGEDIPLHARIIAVCDTFDAITSTRSYRAKSSRAKALEIIKENSGTQFDPDVVEAFVAALPRGVPGVAAISWLSLPALQKGFSQAALMLREAGAAGVAGAIATSGMAGAVATTAVNPTKYLNRPAIVRVQNAEQGANEARQRASARDGVIAGTSVAAADGTASGDAGVLRAAARPRTPQAQALRSDENRGKAARRDGEAGRSSDAGAPETNGKGEKPDRGQDGDAPAAAANGSAPGAAKKVEGATPAPERVQKNAPIETKDREEPLDLMEPVDDGSDDSAGTKSGGKNKPK